MVNSNKKKRHRRKMVNFKKNSKNAPKHCKCCGKYIIGQEKSDHHFYCNDCWRRKNWMVSVLKKEGLGDWVIKFYEKERNKGGFCHLPTKTIYLSPESTEGLFLHEVAHALHPDSNHGEMEFENEYLRLMSENNVEINKNSKKLYQDWFGWYL